MKRICLSLLTLGMFFTGSVAMAAFADMDADGDGVLSPAEFATGYPDAPAEVFTAVDLNADGTVTEEEMLAAVADGILPAD